MSYRSRIRIRRLFRKLFKDSDPPERVARGIAAGFFAAAFPLPGLQIPFSLLAAWLVRGNKAVAILPQFLSNAGTMLPLAYIQFWLGKKIWPASSAGIEAAMNALRQATSDWTWSEPIHSGQALTTALGQMGLDVVGPLSTGVLLTALGSALISYTVSLVALTFYLHRRTRMRASRGIGPRPPRESLRISNVPIDGSDPVLRYAIRPDTYVRAKTVALLVGGDQAYPEMLRCIAAARKTVWMETYILRADAIGNRFAEVLSDAARRGVDVRLCFDGVGGMGLPQEYVDGMLRAGVKVAVFRPMSMLWKLGFATMNRRNHRKILVIDNAIAFTGGLNIGDEYAAGKDGGEGWRDTHLRLDGEAPAQQLNILLELTWQTSRPFTLSAGSTLAALSHEKPSGECSGVHVPITSRNALVQVLSNREFLQRVRVRHAYIHAIHQAKRYILIENAYFIPDRGIRRALRNAVKRGVRVAVVVAMYSDVQIVAMASRALYGELLASGVRLFEYPRSMVHCKAAVIDDVWSVVSSYNLDHRSLKHNLEAGVFLLDHPFARAMREQVLSDIARSREVTKEFHQSRTWNEALAESLAYQARYWL